MRVMLLASLCVVAWAFPAAAVADVSTATVGQHLTRISVDPVADTAFVATTAGFALLSELIVRTGELRPQAPVDPSNLLGVDRGIADAEEVETSGRVLSDITLGLAAAYALFDASRAAYQGDDAWWGTSFVLYTETVALNLALTNIAKIAFRRPRPIAYFELRETGAVSDDTNSALSFYSGHTATTAGLAATASYLAFARHGSSWKSWVTLALGTLFTTYVAVQRVRARAHFPTDVIAGALVGGGVGVLIPHLHVSRKTPLRFGPSIAGGAPGLTLTGRF